MDTNKCAKLKEELASQPEPQLVEIERFFDGNDDEGSIGCNLMAHPGMESFRNIFAGLANRSDVEGVYAQIAELDPGEDLWPFTDTIYVAGTIDVEELASIVVPLEPDDVGPAGPYHPPKSLTDRHGGRLLAIWWD